MHRLRIVPVALVAVSLIGASLLAGSNADAAGEPQRGDAARMMRDLMSGTAAVGGPFTLTDVDGRRRSLADFRGKVVILYFGYTFCPDVCPADLASISHLMQVLGPDSAKVQPLFVTLDPQRDTAEVLREYVAAFDSRLVALRGSETEVRRVATSYKLYFRKVYPQKSTYLCKDGLLLIGDLHTDRHIYDDAVSDFDAIYAGLTAMYGAPFLSIRRTRRAWETHSTRELVVNRVSTWQRGEEADSTPI